MKKNLTHPKLATILFLALATTTIKAQTCTASFAYTLGPNGYTTFSATAISSPTTYYMWNFGGAAANYTNVNTAAHTYTANGYYSAYLFVSNSPFTCSKSVSHWLYINTTTNTPACPSVTPGFVFSQGSNGAVTFSSTSTGTPSGALSYWQMGDGSSVISGSLIPVTHTYAANSTYIATLTVLVGNSPACGYTITAPVTINSTSVTLCTLSAGFTSTLSAGGVVNFSNTSTGTSSSVAYSWDFGDGSSGSSSVAPLHTYTSNGNYTVTLTANNNYTPACTSTISTVVNVNSVCNLNPGFTYTADSNGGIIFSNTSTGTSTNSSYQWTFGDGNNSTSAAPSHTYANSGTYTVTLQVNDTTTSLFPCSGAKSQTIAITNTCIPNTSFSLIPSGTPQYWHAVVSNTANVAAAEWSWGDNSPNSVGIVTSHTYASAGTYSVCLNVTLTCGATGSFCVSQYMNKTQGAGAEMVYVNTLTEEMLETGLSNNSKGNISVLVSPNPNSGEFELRLRGLNTSAPKVEVYNLIGELVFATTLDLLKNGVTTKIKLENAASGIYFVKVDDDKDIYTERIIVNN